jgi:type I restriction enzyme S subunit
LNTPHNNVDYIQVRLGDVLQRIVGGGTPSKDNDIYWLNGVIPWCSVKDMREGTYQLYDTEDYITHEGIENSSTNLIPRGTVIIATRMGLGRAFINQVDFSINQDLKALFPNDKIDNDYLLWSIILKSAEIETLGSGATVKGIRLETLRSIKIPLPSFPTQQKIARILSAYDDLIENNLKRIKLLEEMAQLTYEEWFVRLKFPGYEQAVIDPETGLPEGWVEEALLKICDVNKNSISKRTAPENIRYIDIASAYTGGYDNPQKFIFSKAPSRARRQVKYGDTIFSTVRPNRKTYSLMLEDDPTLIASTGFAVLTPKTINTYPFIYLTVTHQSFIDKTVAVAGGAAYPAVNQSDFEQIKVTIPCESVIKSFSNLNIHKFTVIGNLKVQNQNLKEARDILLPRLMTGMIDVESLELPEIVANKTTSTASENNSETSINEQ